MDGPTGRRDFMENHRVDRLGKSLRERSAIKLHPVAKSKGELSEGMHGHIARSAEHLGNERLALTDSSCQFCFANFGRLHEMANQLCSIKGKRLLFVDQMPS